jgi:hypothetical protein
VPVYNVPLESITRYDMLPRIEIEKQPTLVAKGKTKYGQMSWAQNQTCEKRNATQEMKDFAEKLKTDYVESVKQKAIERVNNVKLKKCGQPSIEGYKMIYENGFPRNAKLDWQNAKNYKVKNGKLIAA